MTFPLNTMALRVVSTLLCTTSMLACGGGGSDSASADSVQAGLVVSKGGTVSTSAAIVGPTTAVISDTAIVGTAIATTTTPAATTGAGGMILNPVTPIAPVITPVTTPSGTLVVITDVRLQNTTAAAQTSVPVTFGQVFATGHLQPTDTMVGRLEDNTLVPLQLDVKARHADGSVRHAIISAIIPSLAANTVRTMSLAKNAGATTGKTALPAELLAAGFTASASATIAGVKYSASANELLKAGAKATWLAGTVANEWHVSAPLTTAAGVAHPHLMARFAVRYYTAVKKARVDVTFENNWAYEPGPQNIKYDAAIVVGGTTTYAKANLTHLTQARWRKVAWWGGEVPDINTQLNTKYLIASRAVPNYDQTVDIAPSLLSSIASHFTGGLTEPMSVGIASTYMPMTGAHDDIGILPMWSATHVLSMDKRARDATLGTADLAGSFNTHYRDRKTDRPVSLSNYPYMTLVGRSTDTWNPDAKRWEAFPGCGGDCNSPFTADAAHQPSLAYYPYLVTGDYYYLEEMQFWAMWDTFMSNPGYRQYGKGLLASEQVRGQAWGLRTLAEAAYITPDADPLKTDLTNLMNNNLDWYNATYTNNASANKLGLIVNGYAFGYNDNNGIAPWQDDFFTQAVGHAVELGFEKAKPLLAWKTRSPVGRMTSPGVCWIDAAVYSLVVRNAESGPIFDTYAQAQAATRGAAFMTLPCGGTAMASVIGAQVNDMGGISSGNMGYPSNMQPALAYSVDSGVASGKTAWSLFMSRSIKPDYSVGPQFAIVPR